MLMFFNGLIFILIILFMAMRAEATPLTDFELKRRTDEGDNRAESILLKKQLTPAFNFVLKCSLAIFSIILVLILSEMTTSVRAFLFGLGLILFAATLSSFKMSKKIAKDLFRKIEPYIIRTYNKLPNKLKRKILREGKQKTIQTFYSKGELLYLIEKSPKIMDVYEENWLAKIFSLSDKKVTDVMIPKSNLKLVHQTDFLGPLLIDEMHKTGQSIFVVTEKTEEKVEGTLALEKVSNLDNKTSQIAKNIMKREFFVLSSDLSALESLQQMLLENQKFAVVQDGDEFLGTLSLSDFYSQK